MPGECLSKLRLLIGQPPLMDAFRLSINKEAPLQSLSPEIIQALILDPLDRVGLALTTFSDEALAPIIRSDPAMASADALATSA